MRRAHHVFLSLLLSVCLHVASAGAAQGQPAPAPRLSPADWRWDAETFRARGNDPGGPRELDLWSWRDGAFDRIARTRSDSASSFDFGEIPIPHEALYLHVSLRGVRPDSAALLRVERPLPAPRITMPLAVNAEEIFIHPIRNEGEIRIHDAATGLLLLRLAVTGDPRQGVNFDPYAALGPDLPVAISIRQVLADGRQSPAAILRIDTGQSEDP